MPIIPMACDVLLLIHFQETLAFASIYSVYNSTPPFTHTQKKTLSFSRSQTILCLTSSVQKVLIFVIPNISIINLFRYINVAIIF